MVASLLKAPGIDVNLQDKQGVTVLMYACALGNNKVVASLLKVSGIDVNRKDNFGNTVLFYALHKWP